MAVFYSKVIRNEPPDPPGSCMVTCACGERYDSTNKTQRKNHYFCRKKGKHEPK